jgi:hypothetical protein
MTIETTAAQQGRTQNLAKLGDMGKKHNKRNEVSWQLLPHLSNSRERALITEK